MYESQLSGGLMQVNFICVIAVSYHVKARGYGCHFVAFFIILRAKGNHVKLYQCAEVKLVLALESEDMM